MKTIKILCLLFLFSHIANAQMPISIGMTANVEEMDWDEVELNSCSRLLVKIKSKGKVPGKLYLRINQTEGEDFFMSEQIQLTNIEDNYFTYENGSPTEIISDLNQLRVDIFNLQEDGSIDKIGFFVKTKMEVGKSYQINLQLLTEFPQVDPFLIEPLSIEPTVDKPVLYFYPEKEINIDIQLQPYGEFTFTYPQYKNGWPAKISPNGNIQIDGRNYPYLFWEGKLKGIAPKVRQTGFVVKAEETIPFLEEKLALMGLNEREMTDFITFWAPKLQENPYNYIHFVRGDAYEKQIAQLQLSQRPDSKIRIHLWYASLEAPIKVEPQKLLPQKRVGFTVVEWGGGAFDWKFPEN